jgi:hypothetical protein
LLVVSNHFPASLLSPELSLLMKVGDTLNAVVLGGSEAGVLACGWAVGVVVGPTVAEWRRDTDWCAGGRRGCEEFRGSMSRAC